jgi:glycosyltransferase involved in cell wall biosynthesis
MKVLHIIPGGLYGGLQSIVTRLAEAQRLEKIDARVFAIYSNPAVLQGLKDKGVPYDYIGLAARYNPLLWKKLADRIAIFNPNVISFHNVILWVLLAIKAYMGKKCPWVYHAHNYPPSINDFKARLIKRLFNEKLDAFIGVSQSITSAFQQYFGPAIPKYSTIYNGVEIPLGKGCAKEWPSFMGSVPFGRPLIGMGTRIDFDKGIREFVDAIPAILHFLPEARFVLAGDGPELNWTRNYAEKLGIGEKLALPGFIRDISNFWPYLDAALFTAPQEPCPMRVIEPQAWGTIVVGYENGSGSDELVIHGETGILVSWEDKEELAKEIFAIWSDQGRYARMSEAAKENTRTHFSIRLMAQKSIDLYEGLCSL